MDVLFSDEVLSVLATVLTAVGGLVLGKVVKDVAKRMVIQKALEIALPVAAKLADEIAKKTANTTDDKVAAVLKALAENGHDKAVTPTTEAKARELFDQLHAESKALSPEAK